MAVLPQNLIILVYQLTVLVVVLLMRNIRRVISSMQSILVNSIQPFIQIPLQYIRPGH